MPETLVIVLALVAIATSAAAIILSVRARRQVRVEHRYTILTPHPDQPTLCDAVRVGVLGVHRCFLLVNGAGSHTGEHVYGNDPLLNLDPAVPIGRVKRRWLDDIANAHSTNLRQEYPNE
jgi:hypothetical protein